MNFSFIYLYANNTQMGAKLSYSIKKHHPNSKIIQITNNSEKKILGIDFVERFDFSNENIMHDFIKVQIKIIKKYGPTVFLDADMLIIKPIEEFFSNDKFDFSITKRSSHYNNSYINPKIHKENFPELVGQKWGEVMPYNAGIYYCNKIETLDYMLSVFKSMSKNFYKWYGDQIALSELVKSKKFKINFFDGEIYNYTPKSPFEDFSEKKVLHFKGKTKNIFYKTYDNIFL